MGKLAEAYVEIASKTKGFDDGLSKTEAKLQAFVGKATSLMQAAAAAAAGGAVGQFFLSAAEAGSDLGETMSKVKEVFGASTGAITGMAQSMADQFGSVKKVTLDAASNLGLVTQGAGFTASASAALSEKLVRLADDASSFYNVPLEDALMKIRSGMVGEAEPLRAFGVLLSEAAMKTKALQMGVKNAHGELTESQKVMVRSQLIIEGLNKASGDHARTLDSYANQVRKLKGEFENWKADMGAPIAGGAALVLQRLHGESEDTKDFTGKVTTEDLANREKIRKKKKEKAAEDGAFSTSLKDSAVSLAVGGPVGAYFGVSKKIRDVVTHDYQAEADKAAGVTKGIAGDHRETQPEKFARERAAYNAHLRKEGKADLGQILGRRNLASLMYDGSQMMNGLMGGKLGGMALSFATGGLNGLAGNMARTAPEVQAKTPWGGSHVTGQADFLKSAQEKILSGDTPQKEIANNTKDALGELKDIKAGILNLGRGILNRAPAAVVRGREQ